MGRVTVITGPHVTFGGRLGRRPSRRISTTSALHRCGICGTHHYPISGRPRAYIDVIAWAIPAERLELARLPTLTIAARDGVAVPLSQIARLRYD